ncbi:hypothetical protein SETIT_9G472400v2 [Setaria italica]|uniref:Uncharacterized protein n=1 Tax=Setaria italica TaxID=4555 RepID=A0A368STB7_SETIT|nr:hypothetical protein SETIT_9G472400v2 [Setaria italica]
MLGHITATICDRYILPAKQTGTAFVMVIVFLQCKLDVTT